MFDIGYFTDENIYSLGEIVEYRTRFYKFIGWPILFPDGRRSIQSSVLGVRPTDRGWKDVTEIIESLIKDIEFDSERKVRDS